MPTLPPDNRMIDANLAVTEYANIRLDKDFFSFSFAVWRKTAAMATTKMQSKSKNEAAEEREREVFLMIICQKGGGGGGR